MAPKKRRLAGMTVADVARHQLDPDISDDDAPPQDVREASVQIQTSLLMARIECELAALPQGERPQDG